MLASSNAIRMRGEKQLVRFTTFNSACQLNGILGERKESLETQQLTSKTQQQQYLAGEKTSLFKGILSYFQLPIWLAGHKQSL